MPRPNLHEQHPHDAVNAVVEWLRGHHGFESNIQVSQLPDTERGLVTRAQLKAGDTVLAIPASALLNPLTLRASHSNRIPAHLFPPSSSGPQSRNKRKRPSSSESNGPAAPNKSLNTTQLLTLHLALGRVQLLDPSSGERKYQSDWEVYERTLPKSFAPWHPLTWVCGDEPASASTSRKGKSKDLGWYGGLLGQVPRSISEKLHSVKERFEEDESRIRHVLSVEEPFKADSLQKMISTDDLLWAWLNVNTRSVSIPLGLPRTAPEVNNHTLVPLLDMINHSSFPSKVCPAPKQVHSSSGPGIAIGNERARLGAHSQNLIPGKIGIQIIAPERGLEAGQEIYFEYGGHSNAALFTEYGFVEMPIATKGEEGSTRQRIRYAEVDVDRVIEDLWEGDFFTEEEKRAKEAALRAIGSWKMNTIHLHPSPVHPAHSLLMTLRVLHLPFTPQAAAQMKLDAIAKGLVTDISPENEAIVRRSLDGIGRSVTADSVRKLVALHELAGAVKRDLGKTRMIETLEYLLEEELEIVTELAERLASGEPLD